jgi:hypothetical protein
MKFTKILGVVAVAAMALMAFASSASATTLATKGVGENAAVTIEATLAPGASALLTDTFNFTANTCTSSTVKGNTVTPFTVADPGTIGGPITTLGWTNCTEGNPVVEEKEGKKLNGTLTVQHIAGTTNGTVRSTGAAVNVPSAFGLLTCSTNNTDIGTLNGKKEGTATFTINAVLSCTVIGTAKWSGTYTITSPTNLSVEA